jgi:hypothetical protein
LVPLIIVLVASVVYLRSAEDYLGIDNQIQEYSSVADIQTIEANLENQISSLDTSSSDYNTQLKELKNSLRSYQYLEKNYIPYQNLISSKDIQGMVNSKIFFNTWSDHFIMITCILASTLLAIFLFNLDFYYKTAIPLYSTKKLTKKLLINKFLTYIVALALLFIFLKIITIFFLFNYVDAKAYIMVIGNMTRIFSSVEYMVMHSISTLFTLLFAATIVYSISLLNRNLFVAFSINIVIIGILGYVFYHFLSDLSLFSSVYDVFTKYGTVSSIIITIILKALLICILAFLSIKQFFRRELS